jgi:diamine N-acetyltransferase
LLIPYCFETLHLHQLFANITPDNQHSIALFMRHGFKKNGEKKDWLYVNGAFKNQLILQLINE